MCKRCLLLSQCVTFAAHCVILFFLVNFASLGFTYLLFDGFIFDNNSRGVFLLGSYVFYAKERVAL